MASQPASVSAILKAIDIARTIEWYRQVGFDIREVFPEEGEPTWCELSRDGVILQFLGGDETPRIAPIVQQVADLGLVILGQAPIDLHETSWDRDRRGT